MANIKFGTDGWRAIVGKDFTQENVEIVTKAIAKYVFENFGLYKKIIIGYDGRNMGKEFALQSANTLSDLGFNVLYSSKIVPTPVLAFNAKYFDACAIMFTASHNPPEYLGMKFIPDYAGPATNDITDEIVANLNCEFDKKKNGSVTETDFSEPYFEHINKIIDFKKIKELNKNIVFDGLYSATIGYFDKLLTQHDIKFNSIHMMHDPNFGGGMPDPKPAFLKELITMVKETPNTIGLANDGDGDRFGVVNEDGEYVSPNDIIALLLLHLKQNKNMNGCMVKTVSGSLMLNKIAEKSGIDVIETAVGFKNVGEAMRKFNAIIGGEESGGLSIRGHIPEKDGILANLLVLEAMAYANKPLTELQSNIREFAGGQYYNDRIDLKFENQNEIDTILEKFKNSQDFAQLKVIKKDFKDGIKLFLEDNASWVLVRPSGTEPLLRIYFESDSLEKLEKFKK